MLLPLLTVPIVPLSHPVLYVMTDDFANGHIPLCGNRSGNIFILACFYGLQKPTRRQLPFAVHVPMEREIRGRLEGRPDRLEESSSP